MNCALAFFSYKIILGWAQPPMATNSIHEKIYPWFFVGVRMAILQKIYLYVHELADYLNAI